MKKIIIALISLSMIFSSFLNVLADTVAEPTVTDEKVSVNSDVSVNTYLNYKNNTKFENATADIVISAVDYKTNKGAKVSVDSTTYNKNMLVCTNETGTLTYSFKANTSGKYYFKLYYATVEGNGVDIRLGVKIDGKYPFDEAKELTFKRNFANNGDVRVDKLGNQFAPEQKEVFCELEGYAIDALGREIDPYLFDISAGEHTIQIEFIDEPVALEKIVLEAPKAIPSYEEYIGSHNDKTVYTGEEDRKSVV